jgi:DNA-binding transcriptional LysR family regulator
MTGQVAMDIRDLEYLVASANAGNFGRAAEALGLNTSTVSRRIGRLEDELGLALFERGHSGVTLTPGGRAVMLHVRRALAELDAVKQSGNQNGSGSAGQIRLGVRMPPIGEPLSSLLAEWHERHPNVMLTILEMNERDIQAALTDRHLDAALVPSHALWPHAVAEPLYRERMVVALPQRHLLAEREALAWDLLRDETILVQGWNESQSAREFYASFMGSGVRFEAHAASKQSVFALVRAGFGITLATVSQAEVAFPGVVYRQISEENAWVQVELAWVPATENAAVGRFVAFMRDEARSRHLL